VGVIAALKNHQLYINMKLLPVTTGSNIVEQCFSQVKLTLTYLHNCLHPSTQESIMFLKLNAESMTKMTVQMALMNGSATSDKILPGSTVQL
jgi:hypothetical protein